MPVIMPARRPSCGRRPRLVTVVCTVATGTVTDVARCSHVPVRGVPLAGCSAAVLSRTVSSGGSGGVIAQCRAPQCH
jgi:hypothetical protein